VGGNPLLDYTSNIKTKERKTMIDSISGEEYNNHTIYFHYDQDAGDPSVEFDNYSKGEVSSWAKGEVYGWVVEDKCGNFIDSCWGYYGDVNFPHMLDEAKKSIDNNNKKIDDEKNKVRYWAERDVVTV